MTIIETKRELEKKILLWEGVIGIGIINENNISIIEISIDKNNFSISEKLDKLINNKAIQGHKIKIVPVDRVKFH